MTKKTNSKQRCDIEYHVLSLRIGGIFVGAAFSRD